MGGGVTRESKIIPTISDEKNKDNNDDNETPNFLIFFSV